MSLSNPNYFTFEIQLDGIYSGPILIIKSPENKNYLDLEYRYKIGKDGEYSNFIKVYHKYNTTTDYYFNINYQVDFDIDSENHTIETNISFNISGSNNPLPSYIGDTNKVITVYIQLRGNNNNGFCKSIDEYITFDGDYYTLDYYNKISHNVSGNILSLIYGDKCDKYLEFDNNIGDYCFYKLFFNNQRLIYCNKLILPNNVRTGCYSHMFYGCKNLINPPILPAKKIFGGAYSHMFCHCTNLTYLTVGFEEYTHCALEKWVGLYSNLQYYTRKIEYLTYSYGSNIKYKCNGNEIEKLPIASNSNDFVGIPITDNKTKYNPIDIYYNGKIEELESKKEELEKKIETKKEELEDKKKELENQIPELEDEIKKLENEIKELEDEIEQLEDQIKKIDDAIEPLENAKELENEAEDLKNKLTASPPPGLTPEEIDEMINDAQKKADAAKNNSNPDKLLDELTGGAGGGNPNNEDEEKPKDGEIKGTFIITDEKFITTEYPISYYKPNYGTNSITSAAGTPDILTYTYYTHEIAKETFITYEENNKRFTYIDLKVGELTTNTNKIFKDKKHFITELALDLYKASAFNDISRPNVSAKQYAIESIKRAIDFYEVIRTVTVEKYKEGGKEYLLDDDVAER